MQADISSQGLAVVLLCIVVYKMGSCACRFCKYVHVCVCVCVAMCTNGKRYL